MSRYWEQRKNLIYYKALFQVVSVVGYEAESIIDIGSANSEYITWFRWIHEKTQLNRGRFAKDLPGVTRISADFFKWEADHTYDVAMCLQVLEHVEEPALFCDKLKKICRNLVISVPYKWRAGGAPGHIHDPVDEAKLQEWMALRPNHTCIVREPFGPARLISGSFRGRR